MLKRIIKHNELKVGIEPHQLTNAFPPTLAYRHTHMGAIFLIYLKWLIADQIGGALRVGKYKTFRLALVAPAQNCDFHFGSEIADNIFHVRRLARATDGYIADADNRHLKLLLLQDLGIEEPISHPCACPVEPRQWSEKSGHYFIFRSHYFVSAHL